jgi:hypothetical protein
VILGIDLGIAIRFSALHWCLGFGVGVLLSYLILTIFCRTSGLTVTVLLADRCTRYSLVLLVLSFSVLVHVWEDAFIGWF